MNNTARRIILFAAGALIGVVIVRHLLETRAAERDKALKSDGVRVIPGLLLEFAQAGRPIIDPSGKGVLEEKTGAGEAGFARTRRLIVDGVPRYDDIGRPRPSDRFLITEFYETAGAVTEVSKVAKYEFAYADRIAVAVRTPADTAKVYLALKDLGAHLFPKTGSRTEVTARFTEAGLDTAGRALEILARMPEVSAASRIPLEWRDHLIKR